MKRVALTGNIGTGKTTIGQMFVQLGCHLLDSDHVTHELLANDAGVCDAVVREFGPEVLGEDRKIDRRKLGAIVFGSAQRRAALTDILHPVIFVRQQVFLESCAQTDPAGIAIVDAALVVETGNYRRFDKLVVVTCDPRQQRDRLRARGMSAAEIDARIGAQMSMEEKAGYADFLVDNSGSIDDARRQVVRIHEELMAAPE